MVIGTDEISTFVFFNYEWITWITHLDNFDGLNGPQAFVSLELRLFAILKSVFRLASTRETLPGHSNLLRIHRILESHYCH